MIKVNIAETISIDFQLILKCWRCYGPLDGAQIHAANQSLPQIGVTPCKACIEQAIKDSLNKVHGINKDE